MDKENSMPTQLEKVESLYLITRIPAVKTLVRLTIFFLIGVLGLEARKIPAVSKLVEITPIAVPIFSLHRDDPGNS